MIDPKAYDQMKYQVEFMKELTAQLSAVKSGGSDIAGMERELRRSHSADRFEDVYDSGRKGRDQQEETRWQLVQLLQAIAPENYQQRRWGSLKRVRQRNGTYRWLCPAHQTLRPDSC